MEKTVYQSERLYVKMNSKYRHVLTPEVFDKMELDWDWKKRKFISDDEIEGFLGKPITEWPEKEDPDPKQRNMSIIWGGNGKWSKEFGGTHLICFEPRADATWCDPGDPKAIAYFKTNNLVTIASRVRELNNHQMNGGYWLISGHEPDITGRHPTIEKNIENRIKEYETIRENDSDAWNHPVFTVFNCTSSSFEDYPGWEGAFTGKDHDVFMCDIYTDKKEELERYSKLVDIGLSRSKGQFVPNLKACRVSDEAVPNILFQWEWWQKNYGPLEGVCFWNGFVCDATIGIYEDERIDEQVKEVNHMLGLI